MSFDMIVLSERLEKMAARCYARFLQDNENDLG